MHYFHNIRLRSRESYYYYAHAIIDIAMQSDIADGLHAALFLVKEEKPICSPDITFKWRSVLP